MPNFEAALTQLEKSKDNSVLPNWETVSQLQNLKESQKTLSGCFDPLQQQLSQNTKDAGPKGGILNWEALAQVQLPNQNSKETLKNMPPGIPNLDLLLQLQLSKDNSSNKNFSGWDALSLSQMQLAQSQLSKENHLKLQSTIPNLDMLSQLQSFKDNKAKSHAIPNFEALALAQLQLAQGIKDPHHKSLSNIPSFETQLTQNLKDGYSKNLGLPSMQNFEALIHFQTGKGTSPTETQSKNFEAGVQAQSLKENKTALNLEAVVKESSNKASTPGLETLAQLHLAQVSKDGKNFVIPSLNFGNLNQFQIPPLNSKDINKSGGIPQFPNFEALALAQLQLSQSSKDKGSFSGIPNFDVLGKFHMGQNSKETFKNIPGISGYESLPSNKGDDWENADRCNIDKQK